MVGLSVRIDATCVACGCTVVRCRRNCAEGVWKRCCDSCRCLRIAKDQARREYHKTRHYVVSAAGGPLPNDTESRHPGSIAEATAAVQQFLTRGYRSICVLVFDDEPDEDTS